MTELEYDKSWAAEITAAGFTPPTDPINIRGVLKFLLANMGSGGGGGGTGPAGGDLSGTLPNPIVVKINGTSLSGLTTGILKNASGTGVPSIAQAGTDYTAANATVGGDLSGTLPNPTVAKLNGVAAASYAQLASPALTGTPTAPTAGGGTNNTQLATTAFVTAAVSASAAGLSVKNAVVVVGTANVSLTGLQTIDGVTLTDSQRVTLVAQTASAQNGIWLAHSGAWTRPTDFANGSSQQGTFTFVSAGTVNAGSGWTMTGSAPITVDTSPQTWAQFSASVTAGGGLTQSGSTLSVDQTVIAPLASPTLTGTPAAPSASYGTNTTQLATTAFVQSAVSAIHVNGVSWTSNAYTLALTDAGTLLAASNGATAGTINVPANATVAFPINTIISIAQTGAGKISVTALSGATVNSAITGGFISGTTGCRAQYSWVNLVKIGTNLWLLTGDAA